MSEPIQPQAKTAPVPQPEPAAESDVAIRVDDIWKRYRTGQFVGKTLARDFQSFFAKLRGKHDPNKKLAIDRSDLTGGDVTSNQWFWALQGVSFEIKKGEVVSILGRNGAGKSTLLQIICQVTEASKGTVTINGRIASLLQAGVGFNEELTGRENIFLNGTILGLSRNEIIERIPVIAEFSEIEKFLDTPVKRYSSGMVARLGFSVAAHLGADILILDEVFAVGDIPFRDKCLARITQLADEGTTILVVTHLPQMLQDACSRAILLEDGMETFDGDLEEATNRYIGVVEEEPEKVAEEEIDIEGIERERKESALRNSTAKLKAEIQNPHLHLEAAAALAEMGDKGQAYGLARNAVSLNPTLASEARPFIEAKIDWLLRTGPIYQRRLEAIVALLAERAPEGNILQLSPYDCLGILVPDRDLFTWGDPEDALSLGKFDAVVIPDVPFLLSSQDGAEQLESLVGLARRWVFGWAHESRPNQRPFLDSLFGMMEEVSAAEWATKMRNGAGAGPDLRTISALCEAKGYRFETFPEGNNLALVLETLLRPRMELCGLGKYDALMASAEAKGGLAELMPPTSSGIFCIEIL